MCCLSQEATETGVGAFEAEIIISFALLCDVDMLSYL